MVKYSFMDEEELEKHREKNAVQQKKLIRKLQEARASGDQEALFKAYRALAKHKTIDDLIRREQDDD